MKKYNRKLYDGGIGAMKEILQKTPLKTPIWTLFSENSFVFIEKNEKCCEISSDMEKRTS